MARADPVARPDPVGRPGRYAWVVQEKAKGRMALFVPLSQGSKYGGWGPNLTDRPPGSSDPIYYTLLAGQRVLQTTTALESTPTYRVRRAPIFDPGYSPNQGLTANYDPAVLRGPSWIQTLYDTETDTISGSAVAAMHRHELLAEAIPAISLPLGANRSSALAASRNYNMPAIFVVGQQWPASRGFDAATTLANWRHSDLREVAYIYLHGLFSQIKNISEVAPCDVA